MALSVSDMIEQVRAGLADEAGHRFTDTQVLAFLNRAARRSYRRVAGRLPDMFAVISEGTVTAGDDIIGFEQPPLRILALYVNGEKIPEIGVGSLPRIPETDGPATSFSLVNWTNQSLVPDGEEYSYRIVYVPSLDALTADSATTWLDDVDDVLVEYVTARLGIVDEGDASQELALLAELDRSVDGIFDGYVPRAGVVSGYWDVQTVSGDY